MLSTLPPRDTSVSLFSHLEELRTRLMWSLASVGLASVLGYLWTDVLIRHMARVTGPLMFMSPTEAFVVKMKLAMLLGVLIAAPVLIYHIWRYVGVALTISEKKIIFGVLPFSYVLFLAGAALAWFVVVPAGIQFLLSFSTPYLRPLLSINSCMEFALWITLGLGLLFQLPVVLAAMARWGLVTAQTLSTYRRHAVIIILIVSAIITPGPDVVSQLLLAIPTYILYEISIFLANALQPKTNIN